MIEITVAPAFQGGILFRGHDEYVLVGDFKVNIQQTERVMVIAAYVILMAYHMLTGSQVTPCINPIQNSVTDVNRLFKEDIYRSARHKGVWRKGGIAPLIPKFWLGWARYVARMGEKRGCIGSWWGNRREREKWGDLGLDMWMILGWISRRWDVGIWTGLGWPRIETSGGRL